MNPKFEAGSFVSFVYNPPAPPEKRAYVKMVLGPAGKPQPVQVQPKKPEAPKDHNKEILVLHPNWHNKIHGIDLKRITPAESQVLHSIMDPKVKSAVDAGQWPIDNVPNYPLIRDILRRLDPVELIKNPIALYQQLIKPFIRNKDCYRTYWPNYAFSLKVIKETNVQGHMTNPAPLFHK